jgi:hypothetical protein
LLVVGIYRNNNNEWKIKAIGDAVRSAADVQSLIAGFA